MSSDKKSYLWFEPGKPYKQGTCNVCNVLLWGNPNTLEKHEKSKKHLSKHENLTGKETPSFKKYKKANDYEPNNKEILSVTKEIFSDSKEERSEAKEIFSFYLGCNWGRNNNSEKMKRLHSKCILLINTIMAPFFRQKLKQAIGTNPFSLFLDEINGIEVTEMIGIIIRYYDEGLKKLSSTYLKIIPLKITDNVNKYTGNRLRENIIFAKIIVKAIENTAKEFQLDLKNLVGIGTDNTYVTSKRYWNRHRSDINIQDINENVFNILKEKYELRYLFRIFFTCGSFRKAFSQAAFHSLPTELEYLIEETIEWFYKQHRLIKYREISEFMNFKLIEQDKPQTYGIRWISTQSAIDVILNNWKKLEEHFKNTRDTEKCENAKKLYNLYKNQRNYVLLKMINFNLLSFVEIDKTLECSSPDILKFIEEFNGLREEIRKIKDNIRLNYDAEEEYEKLNKEDKEFVLMQYRKFVEELTEELQGRYLSMMELKKNLNKLCLPQCFQTDEFIKNISDLIKEPNNQGTLKTKILWEFKELQKEWNKLSENKNPTDLVESWEIVFDYKTSAGINKYTNINNLVLKYLSLPFSNADVKRIFKQMNIVEERQIKDEKLVTLNNILMIRNMIKMMNSLYELYDFPQEIKKKIFHEIINDSSNTEEYSYVLDESEEEVLVMLKQIESDSI